MEHAIDQPGSPAEPPATGPTAPPAVECRELVVRYGDTVAVDHLSFTAHAGEIVALLGPNGA
ncbi:MAG TPA: hypothetical protein VNV87_09125, partial [Acidimicrobiales bacterium]|nr:hypothetical protein [Acidimicrobiales bacterium]